MKTEVHFNIIWKIKPGCLEQFKAVVNEAVPNVKSDEPGAKGYQWYFNTDNTLCNLLEHYDSSEAMLTHVQNIGEILPRWLEFSDIIRFEICGDLSDEAASVAKNLGAEVFGWYNGFSR